MKKLSVNYETRRNDAVDNSNLEEVTLALKSYYLGKLFAILSSGKSDKKILNAIILLRNELRADMFINLSALLRPLSVELDDVMYDYQKHFENLVISKSKKGLFGLSLFAKRNANSR